MIQLDYAAFKALCRRKPLTDALQRAGRLIAEDAHDMAARTGDNTPRRVHPSSKNAGLGYRHYDQALEVVRGTYKDLPASYVLATRHAMVVEFGWTDRAGGRHPGRYYLTRALLMSRDGGGFER